jgi:hypothetical protein
MAINLVISFKARAPQHSRSHDASKSAVCFKVDLISRLTCAEGLGRAGSLPVLIEPTKEPGGQKQFCHIVAMVGGEHHQVSRAFSVPIESKRGSRFWF